MVSTKSMESLASSVLGAPTPLLKPYTYSVARHCATWHDDSRPILARSGTYTSANMKIVPTDSKNNALLHTLGGMEECPTLRGTGGLPHVTIITSVPLGELRVRPVGLGRRRSAILINPNTTDYGTSGQLLHTIGHETSPAVSAGISLKRKEPQ